MSEGDPEFEPGGVFEIPAELLLFPATPGPQPVRESRWVLVASNKHDCRKEPPRTLLVVALSAQVRYFDPRWDVEIPAGLGGTARDSMAQADMVFPVAKGDLRGRRRGTLPTDTLNQVRVRLRDTLGLP